MRASMQRGAGLPLRGVFMRCYAQPRLTLRLGCARSELHLCNLALPRAFNPWLSIPLCEHTGEGWLHTALHVRTCVWGGAAGGCRRCVVWLLAAWTLDYVGPGGNR